jgi:cell division protein FtsW
MCGVTLILVLAGHDLGTTILIATVIWIILLVSGVKLRYMIPPVAIIPLIPIILKYADKMRWARITAYLSPEVYQKTIGYQLWLSILALGSGSWTGLGFTQSRMKAQYLPEAHTDFILSIVGEELGYITLLILISAYVLFICLSVFISIKSKDKEGMLLGFGCSVMIALQAIINIGVVSGAFPTKGMPAPFISYGGSNAIVCLICVGFLLSISNPRQTEQKGPNKGVQLGKN